MAGRRDVARRSSSIRCGRRSPTRPQGAGHGGMDFIEDYRLIKCLREGRPTDMNVYDAAVAQRRRRVEHALERRAQRVARRAGLHARQVEDESAARHRADVSGADDRRTTRACGRASRSGAQPRWRCRDWQPHAHGRPGRPDRRAAAGGDAGLKALMPIEGRPFLDYVLDRLADAGSTVVGLVVAPGARIRSATHYAAVAAARRARLHRAAGAARAPPNAVLAAGSGLVTNPSWP